MIGFDLKQKGAIVTGGTSGIGKAIAKRLVEAGAHVLIMGTHHERGVKAVEELSQIKNDQQIVDFIKVNVANFQEVQEALARCYAQLQTVDILVNCAGITKDNLMLKMTEQDWDDVLDVNLKSAFNLSKGVVRQMMKQRYGKIINIASVVGLIGNPGQVNYCASKAGMIGLTQSLAKELASRMICVNCIAPGFISTPMTDELNEEQKQHLLGRIPMGKFGKPEDVANLVLFLASPLSDYLTGEVIAVDGGMTA
jgi:3-oxoacyl-[acyl-carrier protein] reductase